MLVLHSSVLAKSMSKRNKRICSLLTYVKKFNSPRKKILNLNSAILYLHHRFTQGVLEGVKYILDGYKSGRAEALQHFTVFSVCIFTQIFNCMTRIILWTGKMLSHIKV